MNAPLTLPTPPNLFDANHPSKVRLYSEADLWRYARVAPSFFWAQRYRPTPDAVRWAAFGRIVDEDHEEAEYTFQDLVDVFAACSVGAAYAGGKPLQMGPHLASAASPQATLKEWVILPTDGQLLSQRRAPGDLVDVALRAVHHFMTWSSAGPGVDPLEAAVAALTDAAKRVEYDPTGVAIRLYPPPRPDSSTNARPVWIDPRYRFGDPCLAGTNLRTEDFADRFRAGDGVEVIAADFGVSVAQAEEALRYEWGYA